MFKSFTGCVRPPESNKSLEINSNGKVLLDHGEHTGALPGQTLRGPLYRGPR